MQERIITYATPVFFALIALELLWAWRKNSATYRLHDAVTSIGLGVLSQLVGVFSRALRIGIYIVLFNAFALTRWDLNAWWALPAALLFYDFCYYWHHRWMHRIAAMWAAHVVHHSSEDYNLSTALRQTSSGALFGWIPYVPMAIAGVPPALFVSVALIDLLYQFWVHTEQIKKLGWFDRVFVSPSNHRVHHGVNDAYLDKNYGGILVIWDRLFGSFESERDNEPVVYGTRAPLRSFNPLWANLEVYAQLLSDSWHARAWLDKLKIWWMPPGWRPAELQARRPKPAFTLATRRRFDPPLSKPVACYALLQFAAILGLAIHFLDVQRVASNGVLLVYLLFISASLLGVGAVLEGRRWGWAIELGRHATAIGVLLTTGAWLASPALGGLAIAFGVIWWSASALAAGALAAGARTAGALPAGTLAADAPDAGEVSSVAPAGTRSGLDARLSSPATKNHQPDDLGSDTKQHAAAERHRIGEAGGAQ